MDPNGQNGLSNIRLQSGLVALPEIQRSAFHLGSASTPSHDDESLYGSEMDDPGPEADAKSLTARSTGGVPPKTTTCLPLTGVKQLLPPRACPEPGAELTFWDELLTPAMAKLVAAHPEEPTKIKKKGHSIRDKHSWKDVYGELEAVKAEYSETRTGFKGVLRRWFRKLADHGVGIGLPLAKAGQNIVDNEYVKPVFGVLLLLLEAAAKEVKLRKDMLDAFGGIDPKFKEIDFHRDAFRDDNNIRQASIDLVAAVLHAIEMVMGFFVSPAYKRASRAIFAMDRYRGKIDESLESISKKHSAFLSEVNMSITHRNHFVQEQALEDAAATRTGVTEIRQMVNKISSGQDSIKNELGALSHENKLLKASLPRYPLAMSAMLSVTMPDFLTAGQLLDLISVPNKAAVDLEYIEGRGQIQLKRSEMGASLELALKPKFKEWFTTPASSELEVRDRLKNRREMVSGVSAFCAHLVENICERADPRVIPMHFFCTLNQQYTRGQNAPADNPYEDFEGGRAIIASFLHSLASAIDPKAILPIPDLTVAKVQQDLRKGCADTLFRIFDRLVRSLPPDTVFLCIIDTIDIISHMTPERTDDTRLMVKRLLQLSRDPSVPGTFKVLITIQHGTAMLDGLFADEWRIRVNGLDKGTSFQESKRTAMRHINGLTLGGGDA